jgi:glycosyltransferase involved in cell wall biosynthesis
MTHPPFRLLYLLPAEAFGGAERQGVYHLAELPRHGIEVTAFVGPGEPVPRALADAGVSHQRLEQFPAGSPGPTTLAGRGRNMARWLHALSRSTSEIERRIQGHRFDLIFANRTFAWLVAARLSRRLGVPYVIRAGSRLAHPALSLALSLLDHVAPPAAAFYNCRAVERAVGSRLRRPAYSLPNAIDIEQFASGPDGARAAARARLGLSLEGPLIGLAARPAPEKGFDLFAEVARRVSAKKPEARFAVAGEFGWRAHYEASLQRAGVGEAVRFLGHVGAMPDFFRAVDIVVLTSRARSIEASPNALLEAMAVGRPIVATAVGGIPELVRHGVEGYLVRDADARTFAGRILELIDAPERRNELARAGRARAESGHRKSVVVGELAHHLRTIASTFSELRTSSIGALPCESTTRYAPRGTF